MTWADKDVTDRENGQRCDPSNDSARGMGCLQSKRGPLDALSAYVQNRLLCFSSIAFLPTLAVFLKFTAFG
jgi:hypothetical protein